MNTNLFAGSKLAKGRSSLLLQVFVRVRIRLTSAESWSSAVHIGEGPSVASETMAVMLVIAASCRHYLASERHLLHA